MAVKMRLARHGRKQYAFYHIVVANSRAPRDGRYIERIGSYNPNTNPATIDLEFDKALDWLEKGAQPTDTVRAILSYKGVLLKKHLKGGIKKGSFTEEVAEQRFETWMNEKSATIQAKKDRLSKDADKDRKNQLDAETKANEARAAAQAARNAALAKEAAAKVAAATAPAEGEGDAAPAESAE
jgi:small subunit ribosomal protein S16